MGNYTSVARASRVNSLRAYFRWQPAVDRNNDKVDRGEKAARVLVEKSGARGGKSPATNGNRRSAVSARAPGHFRGRAHPVGWRPRYSVSFGLIASYALGRAHCRAP